MESPTIGIRIANGTYFPILKQDDSAKKKVVLSPVKENQTDVKIDIFRGEGEGMYNPVYVGSLILNNIDQESGKVPDVELLLSVNDDGILDAQAFEPISGVKQFLSVSLDSIDSNFSFYDMPDSSEDSDSIDEPRFSSDFEDDESENSQDDTEDSIEDEEEKWSYEREDDDEYEREERRRKSKIIAIILIVLLVLLLGFLAYVLIMRPAFARNADGSGSAVVQRELETPPPAARPETPPPVAARPETPPPAARPETPPPVAARPETPPPAARPVTPPAAQQAPDARGQDIVYTIRWGDTLWDISNTFYRTPWLYRKIARDNNIRNPNRIYAGRRLIIKPE
ncbi:MAG: LysM peptidoglycan-binding domain-containing protein [Spirochaetaceae bacterium]|nr:LysM peptidoglycan-binding domain-containing protein [Spirochaetaceae bacterium]